MVRAAFLVSVASRIWSACGPDAQTIFEMSFAPRLDILPAAQRALWPELGQVPQHFVLYGGTGLALRFGHRQSVDFDFFSNQPFEPIRLMNSMAFLKNAKVLDGKANTLTVLVYRDGPVKLSFFGGLTMGRVRNPEQTEDGLIWVASPLDIGASKMKVIFGRSEAKDYRDIYALLKSGFRLSEILAAAQALCEELQNPAIHLRAISYFEDGDLRTLPDEMKRTLASAAGEVCLGEIPSMMKLPGGLISDSAN